jgi:apolipoprotein N-acyltransferase
MSRIRRFALIAILLGLPLAATPPRIFNTQLALAGLCLFCVLILQLRATKNALDVALAVVALWALLAVMAGPFVPLVNGLGEALRAVAR